MRRFRRMVIAVFFVVVLAIPAGASAGSGCRVIDASIGPYSVCV